MKLSVRFVLFTLISIGWAISATIAQPGNESLIEKTLDQQAKISFQDTPLETAFTQLQHETLITFDLTQAEPAFELLPYGNMTQIKADIEGVSWREAIQTLLRPLALTFQSGRDCVYILPTPELIRHPRRLTFTELNALARLQNSVVDNRDDHLLKQIRQVTGITFDLVFNGRRHEKADDDIAEKILTASPQYIDHILDLYCQAIGGVTWYLREAEKIDRIEIVILTDVSLAWLKLDKRITSQYAEMPVQDILRDLAHHAGMAVRFEPGCIALLDDNVKNKSSLVIRGGTIQSALEAVAGMTGLAYTIDGQDLLITAGDNLKLLAQARNQGRRSSDPMIGSLMVEIPGTDLKTQIFLRQQYLEDEGVLDKFEQLKQDCLVDFMKFLRSYEPGYAPPAAVPPAPGKLNRTP